MISNPLSINLSPVGPPVAMDSIVSAPVGPPVTVGPGFNDSIYLHGVRIISKLIGIFNSSRTKLPPPPPGHPQLCWESSDKSG